MADACRESMCIMPTCVFGGGGSTPAVSFSVISRSQAVGLMLSLGSHLTCPQAPPSTLDPLLPFG